MPIGRLICAMLLVASTAGAQTPWEDWEPRPGSLPRSGHENDMIALGLGVTSTVLLAGNLTIKGEGARALAGFGAVMGIVSAGAGAHMQHTRTAHATLTWSAIGLGVASATTGGLKLIRRGQNAEGPIELSPAVTPPSPESVATVGFRATMRF